MLACLCHCLFACLFDCLLVCLLALVVFHFCFGFWCYHVICVDVLFLFQFSCTSVTWVEFLLCVFFVVYIVLV